MCKRARRLRAGNIVGKRLRIENLLEIVGRESNDSSRNRNTPNEDTCSNYVGDVASVMGIENNQFCDEADSISSDSSNNFDVVKHREILCDEGAQVDLSDSSCESVSMSVSSDANTEEAIACDLTFGNCEDKEKYVLKSLQEWGVEGVSRQKLDDLLHRLRPIFPHLPRSSKTLLKTPKNTELVHMSNGELWYQGIKSNLDYLITDDYLDTHGTICIDIGIDGLPLSRSSSTQFWPVLGRISDDLGGPFIIQVFCGKGKPSNLELFFGKYIKEIQELIEDGYQFNGRKVKFQIRNYILDAPARAFVKCCVGHTGYSSCEKCTIRGEWHANRMAFVGDEFELRTDDSFYQRVDPAHHSGITSPLESLKTGMVSQFRLDYMHLVCEGVFKRLINTWLTVPGPWKLHRDTVKYISRELETVRRHQPSDFNRQARPLEEWRAYKATEFRRLLLYDGIKVFRNIDKNAFKHYLLLQCGVYILASPQLIKTHVDVAEECLKIFVSHCSKIYGKEFVTYNVHSLIHLADECRSSGTLDSFSAFPYENCLKSIKDCLRSGYRPLQQIANREREKKRFQTRKVTTKSHDPEVNVIRVRTDGRACKSLYINGFRIAVGLRDSVCKLKNGDIISVDSIKCRSRDRVILQGYKYLDVRDYYTYPVSSSLIGIVKVSGPSKVCVSFSAESIDAKCVLLPLEGADLICIPLIH